MSKGVLYRSATATAPSRILLCSASVVALGISLTVVPARAAMPFAQAGVPAQASGAEPQEQGSLPPTPPSENGTTQTAAQQAEGRDIPAEDEIVVTGYLESLQSAQALKKNSDVIVDSITAEDIGALPDRSVTEALQRVPGVTINRFAAGVDPDHFSVEGSGVNIRGLTYTRSEFNGRDAFSAGNGSGLGFQDVPAELLGGVDVFKTPSADRIEGGIGGTVNLRTRLPFDQKTSLLAGSLEMNYGGFANKGSPVVSILGSNRWNTPIGDIGLLGSFSYSQLYSRADRIGISSFRPRTVYSDGTRNDVIPFDGAEEMGSVLFPRGAVMGSQNFNRERYGYSAAAQWRSNDGSLEATFQFLRSDARQAWNEHTIEITTDNVSSQADANGVADSRARAGTSINFDDEGRFESGFITGPTGWRQDQNGPDARTPALGLQSNNIAREHYEKAVTSDYSANLRWDATDDLAFNFDYQHVDSRLRLIDNGLWMSSYQDAFIQLNGSDLPTVQFIAPQSCETPNFNTATGMCNGTPGTAAYPSYFTGTHQSYGDPYNSFPRSAMDHFEDSDGSEDAFRIDAEYSFPDAGFLKSVRVGGRYADRSQTARFSIYNWGELSEQWGNDGPVWLDDNVDGVNDPDGVPNGAGSPAGMYELFPFDNFFHGEVDSPAGVGRLFYSGNPVSNYDAYVDYANLINREWEPTALCGDGREINGGFNAVPDRCGNLPDSIFQPGEVNDQSQRNWAGYIMARIDQEFGNGWNLTGNIGVRYTNTRRKSFGFLQFAAAANSLPTEAECAAPPAEGEEPTPFCSAPLERRNAARAFLNGALVPSDAKINYDYWLPSVNLKLAVSDQLQFRAGYFKGVFDPQFGYSRNYFNITGINTLVQADENGEIIPGSATLQTVVTAGNPYLLPTEADNFDLTAEWYFSRVGQLTASLFYKRLTNVVTNATVNSELANNGATFPLVLTQAQNSDETGKVKGVELAYQQVYDFLPGFLKGLGLQATYTYVDSSGVPQTTLSPTDPNVAAGNQPAIPGDAFPLQGLSKHTFNVTPFINVGLLEVRASYNWRSRYLLTIRDVITPFDPIFQHPYGQLDASATVTVTDNFKIGVQAVNITNATTKTDAAVLDGGGNIQYVPRQWYTSDSRFTVLTRFSF